MATRFWETAGGRTFVGRLAPGTDLVEEIEAHAAEVGIRAAEVSVTGAMRRVAYAYRDQPGRRYLELRSDTHTEMSGFVGNLSLRDDRPFLHAHASFADANGETVGGHLIRGCEVFVAEVVIRELGDLSLVRVHDEETGLALW
jgi:uncharacterized protein